MIYGRARERERESDFLFFTFYDNINLILRRADENRGRRGNVGRDVFKIF